MATKPTPTIVVDRCSFAVQDARNFLIIVVKLRYGWISTTVGRGIGLLQTFSMEQQRVADERLFSEEV